LVVNAGAALYYIRAAIVAGYLHCSQGEVELARATVVGALTLCPDFSSRKTPMGIGPSFLKAESDRFSFWERAAIEILNVC
jgi:hypothetical protein